MSDTYVSQSQLEDTAMKQRREARSRRMKETLAGAASAVASVGDKEVNSGGEIDGTVAQAVDALDNKVTEINDNSVGCGVGCVDHKGQKSNLFLKLGDALFKFLGAVGHRFGSTRQVVSRPQGSTNENGQTDGGNS